MGLKTSKWSALMALPLAAALAVAVTGCSDDDPVLGSATITDPTVATTVPATPITTGAYAGTSLAIPANSAPANANVTVAPSGVNLTNSPLGPTSTFDVSAGPTVSVTLTPPGTVLQAPGATLTIPFSPQALVDQGVAADLASLTTAAAEGAISIYKTSNDGLTTEVLTPVAGSATMTADKSAGTVNVSGLLSFSRFQAIVDLSASINDVTGQDAGRLPDGQWFDDYAAVQFVAAGGTGASKVAIEGVGSVSLTWAAVSGLPTGMTLSSSGVLSGRPETATPLTAVTDHEIVISVTDASGRTTNKTFLVNFAEAGIPVILTNSLPSGTVGVAYSQDLSVVGAGGSDLGNYTWASTPMADGGIDFAGGTFSGTPSAITGDMATYSFSVTATDNNQLASLPAALDIVVYNPVEITTTSLPNAEVGVAYNESIGVTGGNGSYTFTLTGSLPAGLSFNSGTGAITGTPTDSNDAQTFTITVADTDTNAANPASRTDSQELSIIFNLVATVSGVAVTGTSGTVSVEFSFTDDDDDGNFYTATLQYSTDGGTTFTNAVFTSGDTTGLSEGGPYTMMWNTGYSFAGDKVGVTAAANVTIRITVTDNTVGNAGSATAAAVTIDNTQTLPAAADTAIIAQRVPGTAGNTVVVEIRVRAGTGHMPAGINFDVQYDNAVLSVGTSGYWADGAVTTAAGKSGAASNPGGNIVRVVIFGLNANVIADGVIGTITFTLDSAAADQDSALTVTNIAVSDPSASTITPVSGVNGVVVIE